MKMERIISFPYIGREYTEIIKKSLENLGLNVMLPPKTTDKTIKIGVKNSSDMICHPYKVTLGNFVEALENGANTLLMYDSLGQCRLRHYHKIQEFTLKNLGYDSFELYGINRKNIFKTFKKLTGKSRFNLLLEFYNLYKNMKKKEERITWAEDKSNIGIIGEIFSCCDETVNYGIENKIKRFGANPYNTVNLTDFVTRNFLGLYPTSEKKYRKQAKGYFNGKLGGHGIENVSNLLKLIDEGIDGIVHILPLTCMPETTVEPIIDYICRNSRTPSLRITIDENISEVNLETRLETFIELIKIKKWKKRT